MRDDEHGPRLTRDELDLDTFRYYAIELGRTLRAAAARQLRWLADALERKAP